MKPWLIIASLFASLSHAVEPLNVADLGQLKLAYQTVQQQQSYTGFTMSAQVTSLNQPRVVSLMQRPQQMVYVVPDGALVTAGQVVATASGATIHHFKEQAEAAAEMYALLEARYQANRPLAAKNVIGQQQWQQISSDYFTAKLESAHFQHFLDYLQYSADGESVEIVAPQAGYVIHEQGEIDAEHYQVFSIVATQDKRLQLNAPQSIAKDISALQFDNCEVAVDFHAQRVISGNLAVFSQPLTDACNAAIGASMLVTPVFNQAVSIIPRSAVFYLDNEAYVMAREGSSLIPIALTVVGQSAQGDVIVSATEKLNSKQVLTTSVSSVKGIYTGLGGE